MSNWQLENLAHGFPRDWNFHSPSGGFNNREHGDWMFNNQQLASAETLRRSNTYVPFQSVFQPDGRHAYNPHGPQYPQRTVMGYGTRRDMAALPPASYFPRDVIVDMRMNYGAMNYGNGQGPGGGGGYGGNR